MVAPDGALSDQPEPKGAVEAGLREHIDKLDRAFICPLHNELQFVY